MFDDLLLERDDDGKPAPGPAFVAGVIMADRELRIAEHLFREAARDFPGSGRVLFVEDTEAGEEYLENAGEWRRYMNWPRDPTLAEAAAWQLNADAQAAAALWYAWQAEEPVRFGSPGRLA